MIDNLQLLAPVRFAVDLRTSENHVQAFASHSFSATSFSATSFSATSFSATSFVQIFSLQVLFCCELLFKSMNIPSPLQPLLHDHADTMLLPPCLLEQKCPTQAELPPRQCFEVALLNLSPVWFCSAMHTLTLITLVIPASLDNDSTALVTMPGPLLQQCTAPSTPTHPRHLPPTFLNTLCAAPP